VHPTQLYEAGLNLVLYIGLELLYRKKRFDGQVFGLYLVAYAVLRVVVELFRGDYGTYSIGIFTPGQAVSAVILLAGIAVLWVQSRAARRNAQA
jgi:phosphatidylglycerol:prolipoprotein diacylglycerol transferase